ncbi:hypothetical protein [Halorarius halobius]|uniref:hypothetical protein n=1 Tax=Halorarius halobius TaxID=2962671 RepID=UPI0020CF1F78|nr:hypothetical protein [Halorarius halobius]
MSEDDESRDERYADVDTSHLEGVEDGCGCAEVWEHTSEREAAEDDPAEDGEERVEADASG